MSDFEQELRVGFLDEASQLLSDAEQCFLVLEENPQDQPTLEKIFRIAHNIKGSSKAVGFDSLGAFTHEFESFLLKCKNGELKITRQVISLLLKCNDHLNQYIAALKTDHGAKIESTALIDEIRGFQPSSSSEEAPAPEPETTESVSQEVPQAEETPDPVAAAPAIPAGVGASAPQTISAPQIHDQPAKTPNAAAADESIRVSLHRVERLVNFVGELVILQTVLREQVDGSNPQLLRKTIHQIGKVTKEVQDLSMGLRMVPLKQTFQKMQRIVRDTSSLLGKKVNLVLEGEETEVDKTVLESLSDPLVHLIRNAVDHGIESPESRVSAGKPEAGTVVLRAFHQGGKLAIEVKDDGGGISASRLRAKAAEKGILKAGQQGSKSAIVTPFTLFFIQGSRQRPRLPRSRAAESGWTSSKQTSSSFKGKFSWIPLKVRDPRSKFSFR